MGIVVRGWRGWYLRGGEWVYLLLNEALPCISDSLLGLLYGFLIRHGWLRYYYEILEDAFLALLTISHKMYTASPTPLNF